MMLSFVAALTCGAALTGASFTGVSFGFAVFRTGGAGLATLPVRYLRQQSKRRCIQRFG